ncbi:MAG TPA: hypothetical protein VFQ28_10095 [Gaiella sp.]|nr:hypothetical protein [Gaiella sp.]
MMRLVLLGAVVGALALVAAGCGGDDESSGSGATEPATWAAGFCQAVEQLGKSISEAGQGLTGDGLPSRDEIVQAVDNAAEAVDTFADDLSALGRPDVPSGEEIQSSLQTATDDARQAFDDAKGDLDEEIDSATDVAAAAGAIAQATQTALTAIGQATSNLQELDSDGTLRAELEDAAECVGIGS